MEIVQINFKNLNKITNITGTGYQVPCIFSVFILKFFHPAYWLRIQEGKWMRIHSPVKQTKTPAGDEKI